MPTTNGDGPSVFARYIDSPEIERPSPPETLVKQSRKTDLKIFLRDILANGPVPATLIKKNEVQRTGLARDKSGAPNST
jgi:hypothetical protein